MLFALRWGAVVWWKVPFIDTDTVKWDRGRMVRGRAATGGGSGGRSPTLQITGNGIRRTYKTMEVAYHMGSNLARMFTSTRRQQRERAYAVGLVDAVAGNPMGVYL